MCEVTVLDCLNAYCPYFSKETGLQTPKRKQTGQGNYPKEVIARPEPLKDIPRRYSRYGITPSVFRNTLQGMQTPDLILMTSMMTYWYPGVFDAIRFTKDIFPGVPLVLGGNYVTLCPEHAMKSGADILILGPGEEQIPLLMKEFLHEDCFFIADSRDDDLLPYPAFDLLPHIDQVPILTSRGCPFRCTYCASYILQPIFSRRDPFRVADEIEFWHREYGVRNFSFYDDALLVYPEEMIIPLLKEIIRREMSCQFHCPNGLHLREITQEVGHLFYRAGFKTIRFGFETSDSTRQKETGGKVANNHLEEAIKILKMVGYQTHDIGIYVFCGLPGQSAEEVLETINYVKTSGARPIITEYSPIPGTALWPESVKASSYPIESEPLFHNNSLLPCGGESLTRAAYQNLKLLTRGGTHKGI